VPIILPTIVIEDLVSIAAMVNISTLPQRDAKNVLITKLTLKILKVVKNFTI